MGALKILVIPGSLRTGSLNAKLAATIAHELVQAGAEVTRISLSDFPMPIYDGDLHAKSGVPKNAVNLKRMMGSHHGVLIVTPEYNSSVPALVKNAIDWISRVQDTQEARGQVFRDRAFAIAAASGGRLGGTRALSGLPLVQKLAGSGKKVFLDLKMLDIGNTIARGVENVAKMGATFLTVHAYPQTMKAAVEARGPSLKILAVTVLTSYDDGDLHAAGYRLSVSDLVEARAQQAQVLGVDGIVCSPEEAANAAIFKKFGGRFVVRGGKFTGVEGQSRSRNVVIEFPDYETAMACYNSPEYQANVKVRQPHSIADLIVIEGYDDPQP